jgi:hypothetical protein
MRLKKTTFEVYACQADRFRVCWNSVYLAGNILSLAPGLLELGGFFPPQIIYFGSLGNIYIYGGLRFSYITLVLFLPSLSLHLGLFGLYHTWFFCIFY